MYELTKSSTNNLEKDLQLFDLASSKQIYESFNEIEEILIKTGYLLEHTANSKISKFKKFILKATQFKEMTGLSEGLTIKSTQAITIVVTIIFVSILWMQCCYYHLCTRSCNRCIIF